MRSIPCRSWARRSRIRLIRILMLRSSLRSRRHDKIQHISNIDLFQFAIEKYCCIVFVRNLASVRKDHRKILEY
jgi:hypothetical protein